jgi:preprotein translocase subunit SecE
LADARVAGDIIQALISEQDHRGQLLRRLKNHHLILKSCGIRMARSTPIQFMKQVRSEVAKVTWPSRKETFITTLMVIIMVLLASAFFLVADQILSFLVGLLLGAGK